MPRSLLALLLIPLLASAPLAWGRGARPWTPQALAAYHPEGHGDHGGGDHEGGGEHEGRDHHRSGHERSSPTPHDDEGHEYAEHYAYYGRVTASTPLVVGGKRLVGELPLLAYLAPGMQVEVVGRVERGRLRVSALRVLYPRDWAYYEGPTPQGWSRVWFAEGRPWRQQALKPSPRVKLLACYASGWRGLPPTLTPQVEIQEPGLWLLTGLVWHDQLRWTGFTRLGSCTGQR